MKIKAIISLLDSTQSGVSKATGNPWTSKELVVEFEDADGVRSTMAIHTMNKEIVDRLETCYKGDEVVLDVAFLSKARVFTRKDGTEGVIRSTECYIKSMEVVKQGAF